ncbi:MAG: DnaJ domain-containing protein [Candidatus Harrisonbacteria bacterium]|nr:DnaJ domain-containing protein [Candidatus Harrisonbacteria bacterium]
MPKDYYQILGVGKGATEDDIKRAYRKLAHQHHPDKAGGNSEKFKEINEAYQVLSNKEKRSQYDRFGRVFSAGGGPSPGGDNPFGNFEFGFGFDPSNAEDLGNISDIFDAFFEGLGVRKRKSYNRGSDLEVVEEITFEEAFRGIDRNIKVKVFTSCGQCSGLGYFASEGVSECSTCSGRGEIRESRSTFFGNISQVKTCPKCSGSGQIPKKPCRECSGTGRVKVSKEIKITIAPGVANDQLIKIPKAGDAGERGAEPGDLYLRIKIADHKIFKRFNDDLFVKKEIDLLDVLLEKKIEIPTISGNKVFMVIPAGVDLRERVKISGEGMTKFGGRGRGDLYVEWEVRAPKRLNAKAKKILEDLEREIE